MKFYTQPEEKNCVDARIGQARATVSTRTRETITAHTDKKKTENRTRKPSKMVIHVLEKSFGVIWRNTVWWS